MQNVLYILYVGDGFELISYDNESESGNIRIHGFSSSQNMKQGEQQINSSHSARYRGFSVYHDSPKFLYGYTAFCTD